MFISKVIVVLLLSCSAFAEKPFVDMSYSEAVQEAKSTNKIIMIDFYTTWCGPCKMLDKTTWKDKKVRKWLDERTIPLKIDAEKNRPLAKKFEVAAYPTMVFIDGNGKIVGRLVGYRAPEQFIGAANDALSGITESSIARDKLKEDENNPMLRMQLANKLVREKKYEEAVNQYVWCWEQGGEHNPSYHAVRASFLLSDIARLSKKYAPMQEKMKHWRDSAKENFDSEDATRDACLDYFALEKKMGVSKKKLLSIYDGLSKRGAKGKEIQSWIAHKVKDEMFAQARYEEFLEIVNIDSTILVLGIHEDQEYPEGTKGKIIEMEVSTAMKPFEALLILKRDDKATELMQAILKFDTSERTISILQAVAKHRDRSDYIETINESVAAFQTADVTDE